MKRNVSRRDFLRTGALAALGVGVLGSTACSSAPQSEAAASVSGNPTEVTGKEEISWVAAADLVVVGGGGAGFTAAIEAARAGSSALILEKCAYCGGDTLRSGGMIMVGGSELQKSQGIVDTQENFAKTELRYTGDYADREMVEEMCMHSVEALEFMQDLGREYTNITQMNPVSGYDVDEEWAPRTHWNMSATTGHFAALQQEAANYENIEVRTNVEVAHLIVDDAGTVIGVKDAGGNCYRANKGVLLATASFGHNKEMSKRFNPMNYWALCYEEVFNVPSPNGQHTLNTGDGIRMAMEIGADLALTPSNCIADCCALSFASLYGSILVNARGQRFVEESSHWGYLNSMVFNEAVRINATNPETANFWIITDQYAMDNNNYLNAINNRIVGTATESYFDLVKKADTLEELAEQTGLPADALINTVARWNQMVENGEDTDFHRRSILDQNYFQKLENGPFYALPYIPYSMGSFGGVRTNKETQVLNTAGEPINRLYAAGAVMSGMYTAPFYNACGWSILGTVHWGRKAGKNISALEPWTTEQITVAEDASGMSVEEAIAGANGNYNAGTYTASAKGLAGDVPVTVEFSDKAIVSISIGENSETVGIGSVAIEELPDQILMAQSTEVDVISGATITSSAILDAVQACVTQAQK